MDLTRYAYEVHRPFRRPKYFRKVRVAGLDDTWAADLVDLGTEWVDENQGFRYILIIIDVWSRFAMVCPLMDKRTTTVWDAFQEIMDVSGRKPSRLWVDQGSEFVSKFWQDKLKAADIQLYHTYSQYKSMFAERFARTLKTKMMRQFTARQTRNWVEMLPDLVKDYNNTKHSSIGMTPLEASEPSHEEALRDKMYATRSIKAKPRIKVGDWVRVARIKGAFEKGYDQSWTGEVFKVVAIDEMTGEPPLFYLQEYDGHKLEGAFYEQELQKTAPPTYILVDEILKERTVGRKKQYFVSFIGWPGKHNRWMDASQLEKI